LEAGRDERGGTVFRIKGAKRKAPAGRHRANRSRRAAPEPGPL
jgi:hypothetical protein